MKYIGWVVLTPVWTVGYLIGLVVHVFLRGMEEAKCFVWSL